MAIIVSLLLHPPTMTIETSFFASVSDVSVPSFKSATFTAGAATMTKMTTLVAEAGGAGRTRETKTRWRRVLQIHPYPFAHVWVDKRPTRVGQYHT